MSEPISEDARVAREREAARPAVNLPVSNIRSAREFAATVLAQEFTWVDMRDYLLAVNDLAELIANGTVPEVTPPISNPQPTP